MKTLTSNLETCTFNYPKIWMKYTPGTRAFYTRTPDTRDGDTIYTYVYSPGNDSLSASTSASNNAIKVFGVI